MGRAEDQGIRWNSLEETFRAITCPAAACTNHTNAPTRLQVDFAMGRLHEGRAVGEYFQRTIGPRKRMLDVGAGNGGVAIGLAFDGELDVSAVDIVPNGVFRELREASQVRVQQIVANGQELPFPSDTFDGITCLEVLEHIEDAAKFGREILRVLKPGGICMVMTPARLKWLARRDPHFGVPGLLCLPDAAQRILVRDILRRTREYDVVHTFWTLRGIRNLFGENCSVTPLWNAPPISGMNRVGKWLWWRFRNYLWDRLLITKRA